MSENIKKITTEDLKKVVNEGQLDLEEDDDMDLDRKKPYKPVSKETHIDLTQKDETETTAKVEFKKSSFLKDYVAKKTIKAEEKPVDEKRVTEDEIKKEIADSEKNPQYSIDDFYDIAETIIDVLETVMVTGLRWYAKDNSDTPYQISEKKRQRLIRQLVRILYKYQAKFSLVFLFAIGLIATYSTPVTKARQHRKKVIDGIISGDADYTEVKDEVKKVTKTEQKKEEREERLAVLTKTAKEVEVLTKTENVDSFKKEEKIEEPVVKQKPKLRRRQGGTSK